VDFSLILVVFALNRAGGLTLDLLLAGAGDTLDAQRRPLHARTLLGLGHAHHLVGDTIRFTLVLVVRVTDGELWLYRDRLQQAVECSIAERLV
jgi:hypothetical protein